MNSNVTAAGFLPVPGYGNGGEPYCEDFNMLCGDGGTPNVNACATVPTSFSAFPSFNTVCGDGIQGPFEDCDCGSPGTPASLPASNVAACGSFLNGQTGSLCTTTCRNVF